MGAGVTHGSNLLKLVFLIPYCTSELKKRQRIFAIRKGNDRYVRRVDDVGDAMANMYAVS